MKGHPRARTHTLHLNPTPPTRTPYTLPIPIVHHFFYPDNLLVTVGTADSLLVTVGTAPAGDGSHLHQFR